jgi:hypothetical protein
VEDLETAKLLSFIIGDFEASWDALAATPIPQNRGNFMFGLLSVVLLEVTCRLCKTDGEGNALRRFSSSLEAQDRRYFTPLPRPCWAPKSKKFSLPNLGTAGDCAVIAAIFNLIRNGQAHQYQQMTAVLSDGKRFAISLTGAEWGRALASTFKAGRPAEHLQVRRDIDGNLWMTVMPNVLFLDIRTAINRSDLLNSGLSFVHMVEDGDKTFDFSSDEAWRTFDFSGHTSG